MLKNQVVFLFLLLPYFSMGTLLEKTTLTVNEEVLFLSQKRSLKKIIKLLPKADPLFFVYSKKSVLKNQRTFKEFLIKKLILDSLSKEFFKETHAQKLPFKKELKQAKSLGLLSFYKLELSKSFARQSFFQKSFANKASFSLNDLNAFYKKKTLKNLFSGFRYFVAKKSFKKNPVSFVTAKNFLKKLKKEQPTIISFYKNQSSFVFLGSFVDAQMSAFLKKKLLSLHVGGFSDLSLINSEYVIFWLLKKEPFPKNQKEELLAKNWAQKLLRMRAKKHLSTLLKSYQNLAYIAYF